METNGFMDQERQPARRFWKTLVFLIIYSALACGVIYGLLHPSLERHMILLALVVMWFVRISIETEIRPLRKQLDRIEGKLDATLRERRSSEHESQARL